ncbi:hypothetical protein V7S43_015144 [Phytophthora oleae]|uniref:Uncharacterized protein n=1 Tax=Phytophthora oleae TaxID=2107226 RepID=A0ABD3F1I2_9STRA
MRETLRCCRALLSEWRLQPEEWSRVVKVVQLVLNQTASPSLGGVAHITATMIPSDTISIPGPIESTTLEQIQMPRRQHVKRLQQALEDMHRKMSEVNNAVRSTGRQTRRKKKGNSMAQFDIGDLVLYADVWQQVAGEEVCSCSCDRDDFELNLRD